MKNKVVVIGGGPAGMMAAGRAGELGADVILLEKNQNLGIKLLITGKGRCNLTNFITDNKELVKQFGEQGKFLFSCLHRFGVSEVIDFFESRKVKTKVERGQRVFPKSDRARDVVKVLLDYLREAKVEVRTNSPVERIVKEGRKIKKVILKNKEEIEADKFVLCVGGKSYPGTGSEGDGYKWCRDLGQKLTPLMPSLVPIVTAEALVKSLEGLSLKNVEISVYKDNKKKISRLGEALFTADGMSGPIILDMSKEIGQLFPGEVKMRIDFKPALSFAQLDKRIQKDWQMVNNKMFKNSLDKLLPQKLIPVIIDLSQVTGEKKVNLITKEERRKLIHLLKEFELIIKKTSGYNKAIVTAGGVDLKTVDPKTLQSKIIDNLYFAGEILDLDGPTGGFNLQACWSTGYVVGESVVK